jgi:hypothetical protein
MNRRAIAQMLLIVILLQSCVTYKTTSTPINKAQNEGRVKIINTNGINFVFNNIEFKDGIYYGFIGDETIVIDTSDILGVYLKDQKKSNQRTVTLAIGITLGTLLILYVIASISVLSALTAMGI